VPAWAWVQNPSIAKQKTNKQTNKQKTPIKVKENIFESWNGDFQHMKTKPKFYLKDSFEYIKNVKFLHGKNITKIL
jgi:hypothetical protein